MGCPKCGAPMYQKGNRMVCARQGCDYSYDVPVRVPDHGELLKENEQLRAEIRNLKAKENLIMETAMEIESFINHLNERTEAIHNLIEVLRR